MQERAEAHVRADLDMEMARAEKRYGPFSSTHEALGVLIEEMDELRVAVRLNVLINVAREATQVAAVALRLAAQCRLAEDAFARRSVK